jgi:two-component system, CitB family, sensor kinase
LHTIVGMLELGWHDEAVAFITRATRQQQEWMDELPRRITDASVAALLIGKASVASERNVTFTLSAESQLAAHHGLGDVLATIVGNLVENAFDAVEGQPRREVSLDIRDRGGDIVLQVRDSGPGVPPALAGRIFEAGYSTKTASGGQRGIGLALVKRLVVHHGGEVSVRNDGGAVFTVWLPSSGARASHRNGKAQSSP